MYGKHASESDVSPQCCQIQFKRVCQLHKLTNITIQGEFPSFRYLNRMQSDIVNKCTVDLNAKLQDSYWKITKTRTQVNQQVQTPARSRAPTPNRSLASTPQRSRTPTPSPPALTPLLSSPIIPDQSRTPTPDRSLVVSPEVSNKEIYKLLLQVSEGKLFQSMLCYSFDLTKRPLQRLPSCAIPLTIFVWSIGA